MMKDKKKNEIPIHPQHMPKSIFNGLLKQPSFKLPPEAGTILDLPPAGLPSTRLREKFIEAGRLPCTISHLGRGFKIINEEDEPGMRSPKKNYEKIPSTCSITKLSGGSQQSLATTSLDNRPTTEDGQISSVENFNEIYSGDQLESQKNSVSNQYGNFNNKHQFKSNENSKDLDESNSYNDYLENSSLSREVSDSPIQRETVSERKHTTKRALFYAPCHTPKILRASRVLNREGIVPTYIIVLGLPILDCADLVEYTLDNYQPKSIARERLIKAYKKSSDISPSSLKKILESTIRRTNDGSLVIEGIPNHESEVQMLMNTLGPPQLLIVLTMTNRECLRRLKTVAEEETIILSQEIHKFHSNIPDVISLFQNNHIAIKVIDVGLLPLMSIVTALRTEIMKCLVPAGDIVNYGHKSAQQSRYF